MIDRYVFLSKSRQQPPADGRPVFPDPEIPEKVRTQIVYVLRATVGNGDYADRIWERIVDHYDYEMGTVHLGMGVGDAAEIVAGRFLTKSGIVEPFLDFVALAVLRAGDIGSTLDIGERSIRNIELDLEGAITEINRFLREGDVPYQFEGGQWVKTSSGYIHQEVVRPALDALARLGFEGALQEFTTALAHARDGRTKEAATEATKALESTAKCICQERSWAYQPTAAASDLFDVLAANGLVPTWMKNGYLGVATIRNKAGAHGQGPQVVPLPPHMATLAVNLAASHIVALIAAHDALA